VPYSPFGSGLYRHSYALPFFDFANEVKMGGDFWDFIGGDGSYEQLLAIYVQVGEEFAPQIEALRER
jgi:type II restriction enzyme